MFGFAIFMGCFFDLGDKFKHRTPIELILFDPQLTCICFQDNRPIA